MPVSIPLFDVSACVVMLMLSAQVGTKRHFRMITTRLAASLKQYHKRSRAPTHPRPFRLQSSQAEDKRLSGNLNGEDIGRKLENIGKPKLTVVSAFALFCYVFVLSSLEKN